MPTPSSEPLPAGFYARPVLEVAREMLGCTVVHGGAAGVIVETEAYHEGASSLRDRDLCSGPGRLTQALGVELSENGTSLVGPVLVLPRERDPQQVVASTRIGITKAAELPWRFSVGGEENVSRPWPWKTARGGAASSQRKPGASGDQLASAGRVSRWG
jgi:3-methyladenine DNA glycosylase Mpg